MKRFIALLLAIVMVLPLFGCGKSEAAQKADELIDAIGTISLDSGTAIANAENAVAGLSDEELSELSGTKKLEAARNTYDALVIVDMIDNMGEITLDAKDTITEIREKYDAASDAVKAEVSNYSTFEAAEKKYTELAEARTAELCKEGEAAMANMRVKEDKVQKMTFYTPNHFPQYIDQRTYALCYVGTKNDSTWVRIVYDYCGEDWIFWEKLTFLIDDVQYYRYYDHFDILRENNNGKVWECIDFTADEEDIELFEAIANSEEAIIRFEGDHAYDLTVSQEDKAAIKDALAVYEYLRNQ